MAPHQMVRLLLVAASALAVRGTTGGVIASPANTALPAFPSATLHPPYPIPSANSTSTAIPTEPSYFAAPSGSVQGLPVASNSSAANTTIHASCTVNIRNANLKWWYAATYESIVGTLTTQAQNFSQIGYYTLVPNTETFDASYTISDQLALTETSTWDAELELWWTLYDVYPVTPTAATTQIVTRTEGAFSLPTGNIIPTSDYSKYTVNYDALGPASVPIATVANTTSAVSSATPFVYLTAYEVESAINGTTSTKTVTLDQPSAFEYPLKGVESSASATGTLPDDFLPSIPESSCSPGTIYATVTVLIVIDLAYLRVPRGFPFLIHIESSVLGFESDDPVNVAETSQGVPFTVSWDFPSTGSVQTNTRNPGNRPSAIPITQGGATNPQPTPATVGSIGTVPVVVAPSSAVAVGSQILLPGGPAITVGGTVVSLVPSATAIVVGGTTSAIPIVANLGSPTQTIGTLLGAPIVVGPSSTVVIADRTLTPGGPAVTIGGNPVFLAPSATALVIRGRTTALPQVIFPTGGSGQSQQAPPILTIGSSTLTANAATQFFIAPGQTLKPGGTATVDGIVVSLGPSANFVVVGGTTRRILDTSPVRATAEPEILIGGSTITALAGGSNNFQNNAPFNANDAKNGNSGPTFVVSGQTLVPGHAITVDGTTISLPASGTAVVVNGVTSAFARSGAQVTPPPLTIGSQVFTAEAGTGTTYSIGSAVLTPGGQITVSGSTISLAPGATALVINGVTTTLSSPRATITNPPILTIGSNTYTAASGTGTAFVISGQTLTPGGTITVDGTTIVLRPEATLLVYGSGGKSTTEVLFPATTTMGSGTITSASASASEGATGQDGGAAPTSSKKGAAVSIRGGFGTSGMLCLGVILASVW